ncbi:hypothetical protein LCGC14_1394750 [marine sediment metagenome]|uniref:DUF4355 domain-containing protein n=1 Tax=marine sediment metagenome TaxID=412755 RepID=A0A0F9JYW7_9ZZZZ
MDGTENQKDTSGATQDTSEGDKGTSKQTQTFTKEQVAESNQKAAQDALSVAGRTAKDFEQRESAIKAEREQMVQAQKARDEAELEEARDDVDKTTRLKAQQKHRETATELARLKQELEAEQTKAKEAQEVGAKHTKEQNAREVATRLNVDVNTLLRFTDGSTTAMEELAKSLPKKDVKPLLTDSSKTTGGDQMAESSGSKIKSGWDKVHPGK